MAKTAKTKVMLHIIMPNQVSGPNTASRLIYNSYLSDTYEFQFLTQHKHAGGKINFSLIKDLVNQIKRFNPDIIHLSGLQGSGFHAMIAAKLCRKKVLVAVRGASIDALNISSKNKFVFGKIVEPLTLRLADKVYTVCQAMEKRDFIQKHARRNLIGTIHNSAPIISQDSMKNFNLRESHGIAKDDIVVAIVGRMVYDKGITYIIDAIKEINNKKLKFLFIGDEPSGDNLLKQHEDETFDKRVFLLGKQKKETVLSILKESDVFLFATLHENLSNALLEASTMGLAIIATNVGGNPEVITDKYNGLLIPSRNAQAIFESINFLAEDKEFRHMLGENAKKYVAENFAQSKLLKKIDCVYQSMIKED